MHEKLIGTVKDISSITGLSDSTVYKYCMNGVIDAKIKKNTYNIALANRQYIQHLKTKIVGAGARGTMDDLTGFNEDGEPIKKESLKDLLLEQQVRKLKIANDLSEKETIQTVELARAVSKVILHVKPMLESITKRLKLDIPTISGEVLEKVEEITSAATMEMVESWRSNHGD